MKDSLEERVARINSDFFLREFSFSDTCFKLPNNNEVELADHVVALGDFLIVIQMKQREAPTTDPEAERTWFKKKVLTKGTKQIRDTLKYLAGGVVLSNDRGHTFHLPVNLDGLRVVKIVLYESGKSLPMECCAQKFHHSDSAGCIHLLRSEDYAGILRTLVTLPEIVDYFEWREAVTSQHTQQAEAVAEPALVGEFLWDPAVRAPRAEGADLLARFDNATEKFDLFRILHNFKERSEKGTVVSTGAKTGREYYQIVKELMLLPRADLAAFRERFVLAWQNCGKDEVTPYRFASVRSGCSFIFIPLKAGDDVDAALRELRMYTTANKYALKTERALGVAMRSEGSQERLVDWAHEEYPWQQDDELERLSKELPMREVRKTAVPPYSFNVPSEDLDGDAPPVHGSERNAKCSCGSGHKYKHCCGAPRGRRRK